MPRELRERGVYHALSVLVDEHRAMLCDRLSLEPTVDSTHHLEWNQRGGQVTPHFALCVCV